MTVFRWFAKESYKHVEPIGVVEHIYFCVLFPVALLKFYWFWRKDDREEMEE